jgi:Protein of unknown function (DUF2793)
MTEATERLGMPFIAPGQAQKETTHNEALAIADMLMQPVVQSVAPATVPAAPQHGQCWIVGNAPSGAWSGHPGSIACWTAGGWRFSAPFDGMQVWSIADNLLAMRSAGTWDKGIVKGSKLLCNGVQTVGARQAAITSPSGGTTIDSQSRLAIDAILASLRSHGLIEA